MEATNKCRQHMTIFWVVVISWPIQVGGHQADHIEAMLFAQRFTELDSCDLGDRIAFIRRLKWPGEERLLLDRLLCKLRVDAAAAKK